MSDEKRKDAEPTKLDDEALDKVEGGRGSAGTTQPTISPTVVGQGTKPTLDPIGGVAETPPMTMTINTKTR